MFYKMTWSSDNGEQVTLDLQPCFPYTILIFPDPVGVDPSRSLQILDLAKGELTKENPIRAK